MANSNKNKNNAKCRPCDSSSSRLKIKNLFFQEIVEFVKRVEKFRATAESNQFFRQNAHAARQPFSTIRDFAEIVLNSIFQRNQDQNQNYQLFCCKLFCVLH
jgi:hypothetical protein